MADYRLDK